MTKHLSETMEETTGEKLRGWPGAALSSGVISLSITILIARSGGASVGLWGILQILLIATLLFLMTVSSAGKRHRESLTTKSAICLLLFVSVVTLQTHLKWHFKQYGDTGSLEDTILEGHAYPRWFLGSFFLNQLFNFLVLVDVIEPTRGVATQFVAIVGSILMLSSSCLIVCVFGRAPRGPASSQLLPSIDKELEDPQISFRFSGIFCLLQPIWLLFLTGYSEYYPFISGPLVISILWCLKDDLSKHSPFAVGLLMAFLALLYVGFVPVALCIGVALSVSDIRSGMKAFCFAFTLGVAILCFFTSQGIFQFFTTLGSELNLDRHAAGFDSSLILRHLNLFAPNAFFTTTYWRAHWYLLFFSGALFPVILCVTLAVLKGKDFRWSNLKVHSRTTLLILLALFAGAHFLFTVPLLGIRQDIDLYFQSYLIFAIVAGWLFENGGVRMYFSERQWSKLNTCVSAAYLGYSVVISYVLLLRGLPRVF